jgi:hypothetical protein
MKTTFSRIGTEIGALVEKKNAAYGSSFAVSGEFLGLLYPNGILPEQFGDALLMVRIFDKLKRIATDNDPDGESPFADITGYGILGVHQQRTRKDQARWSCNARTPSAATPSPRTAASARRLAAAYPATMRGKSSAKTSRPGKDAARSATSKGRTERK